MSDLQRISEMLQQQGERAHADRNERVKAISEMVDALKPGDLTDEELLFEFGSAIRASNCYHPREREQWQRAETIYHGAILERMSS
jgi:hypothetical protein